MFLARLGQSCCFACSQQQNVRIGCGQKLPGYLIRIQGSQHTLPMAFQGVQQAMNVRQGSCLVSRNIRLLASQPSYETAWLEPQACTGIIAFYSIPALPATSLH